MIQIRQCHTDDFDEVINLLRQLWLDKPINREQLKIIYDSALVSESKTYLCATNEHHLLGFASFTKKHNLWPEGPLGYIDELVIDEKYRGQKIGTQLLEHLIVLARSKGCCRIELDCAFYRKDAHRFYKQNGFASRAFVYSKIL
jgi:GNAT superfamily N-acetyltransferase